MDEKEKSNIHSRLSSLSNESYFDSFDRINLFTANQGFDISKLDENVDPDLLLETGYILEEVAKANITSVMTDEEIDEFNDKVTEKLAQMPLAQREVLNVTLVSKILQNMEYTERYMSTGRLRDDLYRRNDTSNMLWIWWNIYKKRELN